MLLLCSVCHIFTTYTRIFLSIQLLVNKDCFHQSSFYLRNFVHQSRGGKIGGESSRLESNVYMCLCLCVQSSLHADTYVRRYVCICVYSFIQSVYFYSASLI